MFRRIYRQRRRIILTGVLCMFALILKVKSLGPDALTALIGPDLIGIVAALLTLLIVGLVAMAATAVWITLLPGFRTIPESVGIMLFLIALFDVVWPITGPLAPVGPFVPIAVFLIILGTTYGHALDRFPGWVNYGASRRFRSAKSAEDLWSYLSEQDDTLEISIDEIVDQDPATGTMRVKRNLGAGIIAMSTRTVLDDTYPTTFRYRFEGDATARNKAITSGTWGYQITPLPAGGAMVTITETHDALLWRVAIQMWLDDAIGSLADHMSARDKDRRDWSIEGRTRRQIIALS